MELDAVKELVALMKENSLIEVDYSEKDLHIRLKKEGTPSFIPTSMPAPSAMHYPVATMPGAAPEAVVKPSIKSPMVGTFYAAPSPNAENFVKIGDHVTDNTVVCIIEAMKVMNEIKADVGGVIREILVKNGDPVEFGQDLFLIDPDKTK